MSKQVKGARKRTGPAQRARPHGYGEAARYREARRRESEKRPLASERSLQTGFWSALPSGEATEHCGRGKRQP